MWLCTDNIVISGGFYVRSAKFSSFLSGISFYLRSLYRVPSHTIYCNFCWDIEYSSLYREYHYIKDRYNIYRGSTVFCYVGGELSSEFENCGSAPAAEFVLVMHLSMLSPRVGETPTGI